MNAGIQTAIDTLGEALLLATDKLKRIDADIAAGVHAMTYTDGNQTYGWNEYRAALLAQIDRYKAQIEDLYKANQVLEGPFEVVAPAGGYSAGNGWW